GDLVADRQWSVQFESYFPRSFCYAWQLFASGDYYDHHLSRYADCFWLPLGLAYYFRVDFDGQLDNLFRWID
ncbi:hypothetical protein ACEN88_35985, partial [Massilia sp. CT11-108]|uniref:hypothetical protein n=1 Tax=Massilia sp. CT11-108 TaxID=3393900 RepID=UPI0039A721AA